MSYISSLKLHNFRCYAGGKISDLSGGMIVLTGENGAGKTNILEAISLLAPGRGLRGSKPLEIQNLDDGDAWGISACVQMDYEQVRLGTGINPENQKRRIIRINGETVKSQSALADYMACVWLTPQMDRLFMDSASHRRRFLDRLVFAFDPGHSGRVSRYENAMRQRSKLLQEGAGGADPAWLDGLEAQMAETGVALAAARLDFVGRLQAACDQNIGVEYFPRCALSVSGTIEELLKNAPALEVEELFKYQLQQSRARDGVSGGALSGPHKSDLYVSYAARNMAADQCSTGEQKALLIGIVLAHARLVRAERGAPPILLLDEIAAHLDEGRRAALYDLLEDLGAQVWLTGTEENLFDALATRAQFFKVCDAVVEAQGMVDQESKTARA